MTAHELARRAGACRGWRWMPGMLTLNHGRLCGSGSGFLVIESTDDLGSPFVDCSDTVDDWLACLPDLSDPATLGCLLALVREAWEDPLIVVVPSVCGASAVEWKVYNPHDDWIAESMSRPYQSEAAALVAALEAAP